jgi:hypothetical protein
MMTSRQSPSRHFPVIRVFVSSTFSDLVAERNALAENVWPELERYCRQRGFTFQAIDLRWGVPGEAGLDHRTMQICFEELHRAQETSPEPNFLILLGDKYGWRPLPETISETEYAPPPRACAVARGCAHAQRLVSPQRQRHSAAVAQASPDALDLELRDHCRFARERGPVDRFVGRKEQVRTLRDYLQATTGGMNNQKTIAVETRKSRPRGQESGKPEVSGFPLKERTQTHQMRTVGSLHSHNSI